MSRFFYHDFETLELKHSEHHCVSALDGIMLQGISGLNFITKVKSKITDLHYLLGLFDYMDTCVSNCV